MSQCSQSTLRTRSVVFAWCLLLSIALRTQERFLSHPFRFCRFVLPSGRATLENAQQSTHFVPVGSVVDSNALSQDLIFVLDDAGLALNFRTTFVVGRGLRCTSALAGPRRRRFRVWLSGLATLCSLVLKKTSGARCWVTFSVADGGTAVLPCHSQWNHSGRVHFCQSHWNESSVAWLRVLRRTFPQQGAPRRVGGSAVSLLTSVNRIGITPCTHSLMEGFCGCRGDLFVLLSYEAFFFWVAGWVLPRPHLVLPLSVHASQTKNMVWLYGNSNVEN